MARISLLNRSARSAGPHYLNRCQNCRTINVINDDGILKSRIKSLSEIIKIHPKSTRKRPQIDKSVSLERFRPHIAPWSAPGRSPALGGLLLLAPLGLKMSLQGSFLGSLENRKSVQNRTCEHRRALWPSKSSVWEWVRKKHQNSMKKRCENRRFLMAQNHVWRYTLRL